MQPGAPVRDVLIVGGGSAGWMAAAFLSRALGSSARITLVESADIGIVGVGEATIPPIRQFNRFCGVDEAALLRDTGGTFKLGIEFENWGRIGDRYLHAFGRVGRDLDAVVRLHHWWVHAGLAKGAPLPAWDSLFLGRAAADGMRFAIDPRPGSDLAPLLPHAYHFDAIAYGQHLRGISEARGVRRVEGTIISVERDGESGNVSRVNLADGTALSAQLFVDCTGLASLLLGKTMEEPFEDWSHWLPADRALAVQSERLPGDILPITRAIAQPVGWQWRIPLRTRTGNGHVFASAFDSENAVAERLIDTLDAPPIGEPRLIRFATGRRKRAWQGNVVAIGLSAGFLEPLESTSIHLVQSALERLVEHFPTAGMEPAPRERFNRLVEAEWCQVRDFVIAHYKVTSRSDTEFWRYCREMSVPDTLSSLLDLWAEHGILDIDGGHLFQWGSWTSLLLCQGLVPRQAHPLTARADAKAIAETLQDLSAQLRQRAAALPSHAGFLESYLGNAGSTPRLEGA